MLKPGDKAPDFSLPDQDSKMHALKDERGKNVVLYFYPKDATPGCTVEACEFRDKMSQIASKDAVVLGVGRDSVQKHKSFKEKFHLPFNLLSDPAGDVTKAYGSWGEKSFMG